MKLEVMWPLTMFTYQNSDGGIILMMYPLCKIVLMFHERDGEIGRISLMVKRVGVWGHINHLHPTQEHS